MLLASGVGALVETGTRGSHLAHHLGDIHIWRRLIGRSNSQCPVVGNHLSENLEDGLSNSLVINVDKLARGRVDLEGLVESESGIENLGGCRERARLDIS